MNYKHYFIGYPIRDIKDENIVIDHHYRVKLIDFGSAAFLPTNGRLFDRFAGTIQYCPPEILQGEKYRGPEQEVWSLGILLYTMIFAEAPFSDPLQAIHQEIKIPLGMEEQSPNLVNLLHGLMEKQPLHRLSVSQILDHEWVRKG
jgi:serine/threonine protein kinase